MGDVDGAAGVDDLDGAAGANDAGKGAGRDGRSLLVFVLRCCVGPLITRKGTGWKTSVVSMMSEWYSAAAMVLCFGGDHGAL